MLIFITAPTVNVLPPTAQNTENCKHLINECVAAAALSRPCSMLSIVLRAPWLHVTLPSIPPAFPCWHPLSTAQEQNSEGEGGVAQGHMAERAFTSKLASLQNPILTPALELGTHARLRAVGLQDGVWKTCAPAAAGSRNPSGWSLHLQCAPYLVQRATMEPKETGTL